MPRRAEQEPNREQMLAFIKASAVKINSIQGRGPGTGKEPNISKLSYSSLKSTYDLIHHVVNIMEGNTF